MHSVTTTHFEDLHVADGDLRVPRTGAARLTATQFLARASAAPIDYRSLVDACCDSAGPMTRTLVAKNYRSWILLIGAANVRRRFPNYKLAAPLQKANLASATFVEDVFPEPQGERTAGIYLTDPGKFCDACWFLTLNSWAIMILSARDDFASSANLSLFYERAGFSNDGKVITTWRNWPALASAVCPLGDVVVTTVGAFDDRQRGLNFIYAAANAEGRP